MRGGDVRKLWSASPAQPPPRVESALNSTAERHAGLGSGETLAGTSLRGGCCAGGRAAATLFHVSVARIWQVENTTADRLFQLRAHREPAARSQAVLRRLGDSTRAPIGTHCGELTTDGGAHELSLISGAVTPLLMLEELAVGPGAERGRYNFAQRTTHLGIGQASTTRSAPC